MENGTLTHYIDGNGIDEPVGWEDFTEDLERNFDQRIIATTYPIEVTFTGGANETLRALYLENFCATVTYEVDFHCQGSTYRVVRGVISLADVEWNLNKCTAKVKVQDDGYGARIFNNKDIKVYPTANVTKNGLALTPVTPIALEVYDPTAAVGTYLADTRVAFDWLACMEHIVGYITDNELTAQSNWYDGLDDAERFALVYGHELRVADGSSLAPYYSFKDLFANAWKKYNLWAYVERSATGAPILRIETDADTYGTGTAIAMLKQDDLLQGIDTDLLYARVEIGSEKFIKDESSGYSLPYLPMQGFTREEYHLLGTCNTDAVLNLVSSFVIDNDVIEDSAINNSDDHDNEVFMIQYDQITNKAVKSTYLIPGGPPFLYNEALLNITVANRWRLQADGVVNFNEEDATFQATHYADQNPYSDTVGNNTTVSSSDVQVQFSNDFSFGNFDNGNNYGNGTIPGNPVSQANSRYADPILGFYQFGNLLNWSVRRQFTIATGGYTETIQITSRLRRFNSLNVQVSVQDVTTVHTITGDAGGSSLVVDMTDSYSDLHTFSALLQPGDYVMIMQWYTYSILADELIAGVDFDFTLTTGTNFYTLFVATGGGVLVEADPDEYKATKYTFDRHSNTAEWIALRDDPTQNVIVATDSEALRTTYPLKVSRNIATGETAWETIADRNQPNK